MAQPEKAVETKVETVVETPKAPEPQIGMQDVLSRKAPEPKVEAPKVEEPKLETVTKPAETAAKVTEPANGVTEPEPDPKEGLVKGLQAERKKRQEIQKQLMEANARNAELMAQSSQAPSPESIEDQMTKRIYAISEGSARATHSDFQEKFDAFNAAVFDGETTNHDLYNQVMNSDHPAEAVYHAGKMLLFQKEHGYSLDEQVASIEKKAIARERERIRQEVEAEFKGKIAVKEKQPTNLLTTRSSGNADDVPFVQPGIGDVLGATRRR